MLPDLGCCDTGTLCCEAIFKQCEHVLFQVAPVVLGCIEEQACCENNLQAFVSHGEPEVWQSDYLTIWLAGMQPSQMTQSAVNSTFTAAYMYRLQFSLRLCESNYPMADTLDDGTKTVPSIAQLHISNRYVYSHGEMMLRALLKAAEDRVLTVQGFTSFQFFNFSAIPTQRGTAGYQANFTMDMSNWGI